LLLGADSGQGIEAGSAPGGEETTRTSHSEQDCGDREKHRCIERGSVIEQGTDELRSGDAADDAECESGKSGAHAVEENQTERLLAGKREGSKSMVYPLPNPKLKLMNGNEKGCNGHEGCERGSKKRGNVGTFPLSS
jgi:hypothetical protein